MSDQALVPASAGAERLKNVRHERYARARALLASRIEAMREAGFEGNANTLSINAVRVEGRADVQARLAYLQRQDDAAFQAKRRKLEEYLWAAHDYNPADLYEVVERPIIAKDGKPVLDTEGKVVTELVERPKMLCDLPPELQHIVESREYTKVGLMPRTYSKLKANEELRRLLGIGTTSSADGRRSEYDRMTDQELIESLTKQANELGIEINLSKALGLEVPATLLARADEVIE